MEALNVPTATISEVKVSPGKIFKAAESNDNGVYIFNRGSVVGVMLTREQYEQLTGAIEALTDRLIELEAEKRIATDGLKKYPDAKVRDSRVRDRETVDMNDGWD
jgi:PHD/YefM family antitoxin component YafN of YafNO toxin-antitoxin module